MMIDIKKIKNKLKKVEDNGLYNPDQILEMGLITDTKQKPSIFTIYRLIKHGKLKHLNHGSGGSPRYFVKGVILKEFIKERYSL